jgi:hypothetical protein
MKRYLVVTCGAVVCAVAASATAGAAAKASDRGWEVALVHTHTRAAATATLKLVAGQSRAKGLTAVIELDGKGDFEVAITGFRTEKQAAAARTQSRAGFKGAAVERT